MRAAFAARGAVVTVDRLGAGTTEGDYARRASDLAVFFGAELSLAGAPSTVLAKARLYRVVVASNGERLRGALAQKGIELAGGPAQFSLATASESAVADVLRAASEVRSAVVEIVRSCRVSAMAESHIAASPRARTSGRLGILTGLSLAVSAIPLPILPERLVFQIRGAIAQDVAGRHGLSLTTDARRCLAESGGESPMRDVLKRGLGFLCLTFVKKLSPLSTLFSASSAFEVFASGHLVDRYLEQHRGSKSVRIQVDEAPRAPQTHRRGCCAFSPTLKPDPMPLPPVEDLRDEFTRWVDTLLLLSAGLPGWRRAPARCRFDALRARARLACLMASREDEAVCACPARREPPRDREIGPRA
jgi:hypothetical protein